MKGLRNLIAIKADSEGNAPSVIEVLRVGDWHTPWHGDFQITTEDLNQFVANFQSGVGLVASDKQAPVNFGHFMSGEAAGWITSLEVSEDGQALNANVEWTEDAASAIKAKKWKYISPEFNPRSWPWEDPEEEHHFVNNVVTAAALTNIPLFKKLKPITASRLPGEPVKADKSSKQEGESMNLEEILAKAAAERTDEEKAFLDEHKAELTEEQTKQLEAEVEVEAPATPETPKAPAAEEAPEGGAPVSASVQGISDAELAQLRADAKAGREAKAELERTNAAALVDSHIAAGRIKSDQKEATVKMILASQGDARTSLESFLAALPVNGLLASEQGTATAEAEDVTLTKEEEDLAKAFGNSEDDLKATKEAEAGK